MLWNFFKFRVMIDDNRLKETFVSLSLTRCEAYTITGHRKEKGSGQSKGLIVVHNKRGNQKYHFELTRYYRFEKGQVGG